MTDENKRIEIDDLPRAEQELTDEEEKSVTGGAGTHTGGILVGLGDGSVRNTAGDSVGANKVEGIGGSRTGNV